MMSIRENSLTAVATRRSTSARLATSQATLRRSFGWPSSPAVFARPAPSTSEVTTLQPSARNRSAQARPMPRALPVMTATLPDSFMSHSPRLSGRIDQKHVLVRLHFGDDMVHRRADARQPAQVLVRHQPVAAVEADLRQHELQVLVGMGGVVV